MNDIKDVMVDLNLTGKILEISDVRAFQRKDGTIGKVGNLLQEIPRARLRLFSGMKNRILTSIEYGDTIEIINVYAKEKPLATKLFFDIVIILHR
jgi:replication factor A1